jgi:hypothetical protein
MGSAGACQTAGTTGSGGAGGTSSTYTRTAVCGRRGQATATATSYAEGWEEVYMIDDEGMGVDICVVRMDVTRVGAAPGGCTECSWTQTVSYSNPRVVTDTGGVCANSDLGLTAAKIAALGGTRASVGFIREWQGAHGSVRFMYTESTCTWELAGTATWDEMNATNPTGTNLFRYTDSDGFCKY